MLWVISGRTPSIRSDDAEQIDLTLAEQGQLQLVPSFFVWPRLTTLVHKVVQEDQEQLAVLIVYSLAESRM